MRTLLVDEESGCDARLPSGICNKGIEVHYRSACVAQYLLIDSRYWRVVLRERVFSLAFCLIDFL